MAKVHRIGYLGLGTPENAAPLLDALTSGLRDFGLVDGGNLSIERRYAHGNVGRLSELAAELVQLRVDAIVAATNVVTAAAQRATATIPVVMVAAFDPVGAGFVASLAKPNGNITGLSLEASREWMGKQLAFLKEASPKLSRVGVLRQENSGGNFAELDAVARRLNVAIEFVNLRNSDDIEVAFATLVDRRVGGVIIFGGANVYMQRHQIADLALRYRLPAIHTIKETTKEGLLMSYGPNLRDLFRRAAGYVVRD